MRSPSNASRNALACDRFGFSASSCSYVWATSSMARSLRAASSGSESYARSLINRSDSPDVKSASSVPSARVTLCGLALAACKSCVSPRRSLQVLEMACKLGPGQRQTGKIRYRTEDVKEALETLIANRA
jgi:hypothetical protein